MNYRKALSVLSTLIGILWVRAIWEFYLTDDLRMFLIECTVVPFSVALFALFVGWVFHKMGHNANVMATVLIVTIFYWSAYCWAHFSKVLAAFIALVGVLIAAALLQNVIAPDSEVRRAARRARTESLFADRDAFEKNWRRKIKITEGILIAVFALLAVICWTRSFKMLAILPALLGALFLIGIFATLTPMSEEKYEERLAKAKARHERFEARRTMSAIRRADRAERREERKKRQGPSSPAAESFQSFINWMVIICIFGIHARSRLEKPDLVLLAMPTWFLIRASYYHFRKRTHPKVTEAAGVSNPPTIGIGTE